MKKNLFSKAVISFVLIIFFLVTNCNRNTNTKQLQSTFTETFIFEKEIQLDTNTVYEIRYLDVNSEKDLLVTNRRRTEVFLFDSLGSLKARLSERLDDGFPGANWSPTHAYFTANDEIFVSNRAPWGIWFSREGVFKKMMPKEYLGTDDLAFDYEDHVYSLNKNYIGIYISKYDSSGIEKNRIGDADSSFHNIMRHSIIGNSLLVVGEDLYYKNISNTNIYKYNKSGKLIDTFSETPVYYKAPEDDISSLEKSGGEALPNNVFEFARKYTANYSMHHLDEELILVQFVNMGGNYGYQIITTDGEYILDYDLQTNKKIFTAKEGYVYTITPSDTIQTIEVYKFNPSNIDSSL